MHFLIRKEGATSADDKDQETVSGEASERLYEAVRKTLKPGESVALFLCSEVKKAYGPPKGTA